MDCCGVILKRGGLNDDISLNGRYFIPTSLIYFGERGVDGLSLNWRERADGSFTKLVYEEIMKQRVSGYLSQRVVEELDFDYGEENWRLIPVFSIYNSKDNFCENYFITDTFGAGCKIFFTTHDGKEAELEFSDMSNFVETLEPFEVGLDEIEAELTFGESPIDLRHLVAQFIRLSQKKVLSISIG